jgi:hypothetical protein
MILVWFLDLKFLCERAAKVIGTQIHHTRSLLLDARDLHRFGPERNIRGDQGGELGRRVAERVDA